MMSSSMRTFERGLAQISGLPTLMARHCGSLSLALVGMSRRTVTRLNPNHCFHNRSKPSGPEPAGEKTFFCAYAVVMMSLGARALSSAVALIVHDRHAWPSRGWPSKMTLLAYVAGQPLEIISMSFQFLALAIRCNAPRQCSA